MKVTIELRILEDLSIDNAKQYADWIYDNFDYECQVVITEQDKFDGEGVFCEGCDGNTIPGIRWPSTVNGDRTQEWVERCDLCERYDSDEAARDVVVETYINTGAKVIVGNDPSKGYRPYVTVA